MAIDKRDKITSFALTVTEKRELIKVCDNKRVGMSDYIRDCVMKQIKRDSVKINPS